MLLHTMRRRPKLLKQSTEQVKEGEIAASMSDDQLIAALTAEVGIPVGDGAFNQDGGGGAAAVCLPRVCSVCRSVCRTRVV